MEKIYWETESITIRVDLGEWYLPFGISIARRLCILSFLCITLVLDWKE